MIKRFVFVSLFLFWPSLLLARAHQPSVTYLRFKPLHGGGIYARIHMVIHHRPWGRSFPTLPRAANRYPRLRVKTQTYSPWLAFGRNWGTLVLTFYARHPLAQTDVQIQLANATDANAVFKAMQISTKGNRVSLCLPPDFRSHPNNIITVRAMASHHLKIAQTIAGQLHLNPSPPHMRFSFLTGAADGFGSVYSDPTIAREELRTIKTLGINGTTLGGDGKWAKLAKQVGFDRYMVSNGLANPRRASEQKAALGKVFKKIRFLCLMDEPGNDAWHRLDKIPVSRFHGYLESQGLTPRDFAASSWDAVKPLRDRSQIARIAYDWGSRRGQAAAKEYYWTVRYSEYLTTMKYRKATNTAKHLYPPGTLMFVNFTDHPLILGGSMLPGSPNWFKMGLDHGTTLMWSEDWMYGSTRAWGNGLFQRIGYLVDMLRSAASKYHQPLGYYNTMDNGQSLRLKAFTAIGHGVKTIYFFDYGPRFGATENYWSNSRSEYEGVARIIKDVRRADSLVYPGQPPHAKVGLIYSTAEEIWANRVDAGALQQERELIHIALNQEHYPVDVLDDDLLLHRNLSRYKVIYLVDQRLPEACLKKLKAWVKAGGELCVTPGAGSHNEYNRATTLLSNAIGVREKMHKSGSSEGEITFQQPAVIAGTIPIRFAYRKAAALANKGKVLATFANNQPAVILHAYGHGKVLSYMFMPGLNYFKQVMAANQGKPYVTIFPAAARHLITFPCYQDQVVKPVQVSDPVVEADLLASRKGAALVLANYTRKPIAGLRCSVALHGIRSVYSVEQGKLTYQRRGGRMNFSVPLNVADIILLRK